MSGAAAQEARAVMDNDLTVWLDARFPRVTPRDFYRDIFPAGELDGKDAYTAGKYTGIIVAVTDTKKADGHTKIKRYSLTDDLDAVDIAAASNDFCLCAPISYAGKQRTAERARYLYAIAVDLDRIRRSRGRLDGLEDLIHQTQTVNGWKKDYTILPRPTYIVSSGTGLHLYFVLDKPIPLYPEYAKELQRLKHDLTDAIWNGYIVDIKSRDEVQQEGIYQGFRMPGTVTKNGGRAVAFKTGERVTLEYLNVYVKEESRAEKAARIKKEKRGAVSLKDAAQKFPEWYERRIVKGEPRGIWHTNRALYDWWLRKIPTEAKTGHRYYCVMMLAVYAQKCSRYDEKHNPVPVTEEELERDAYGLVPVLDEMTDDENNHFGVDDVQDALEAFQERWITYPRAAIEYRTGIEIKENKRNGQKQADHLAEARAVRDVRAGRRGERWDAHNGRKSAAAVVMEWREHNPGGTKADCVRDTGLTKPTVYKHWEGGAEATGGADREAALTLAQIERRIKAELEKQRAAIIAYEKILEEMRAALDTMPNGEEKERYKKRLEVAEEDLADMKKDFPGKV